MKDENMTKSSEEYIAEELLGIRNDLEKVVARANALIASHGVAANFKLEQLPPTPDSAFFITHFAGLRVYQVK